jgi:integrase
LNTDTDGFEFLFRSRLEGRFTTISKAFNRIRKLAGLSFLNLHLLRHQHASFLVNS